jgi:chromosome segregation ATPase
LDRDEASALGVDSAELARLRADLKEAAAELAHANDRLHRADAAAAAARDGHAAAEERSAELLAEAVALQRQLSDASAQTAASAEQLAFASAALELKEQELTQLAHALRECEAAAAMQRQSMESRPQRSEEHDTGAADAQVARLRADLLSVTEALSRKDEELKTACQSMQTLREQQLELEVRALG